MAIQKPVDPRRSSAVRRLEHILFHWQIQSLESRLSGEQIIGNRISMFSPTEGWALRSNLMLTTH